MEEDKHRGRERKREGEKERGREREREGEIGKAMLLYVLGWMRGEEGDEWSGGVEWRNS